MSALSYYFEREGLLTTGISLVRENTLSMQPPRALWVPFPLGRPLGMAGDPEFQMNVIRAAIALLDRGTGPILEDYPHDMPVADEATLSACPVSFPKTVDDSWSGRLLSELGMMEPWYQMSVRRRDGRTLVGLSEFDPSENMTRLAAYLDEGLRPDDIKWLKPAIEDLKAYYLEAMRAKPGAYDENQLFQQFWAETQLGAAILSLCEQYQGDENPAIKIVARMLAPREAVGAATGPVGPTSQHT